MEPETPTDFDTCCHFALSQVVRQILDLGCPLDRYNSNPSLRNLEKKYGRLGPTRPGPLLSWRSSEAPAPCPGPPPEGGDVSEEEEEEEMDGDGEEDEEPEVGDEEELGGGEDEDEEVTPKARCTRRKRPPKPNRKPQPTR